MIFNNRNGRLPAIFNLPYRLINCFVLQLFDPPFNKPIPTLASALVVPQPVLVVRFRDRPLVRIGKYKGPLLPYFQYFPTHGQLQWGEIGENNLGDFWFCS